MERTFAVVDLETTGGSPKNDRILEVAIVIYHEGERGETFSSLVNPERSIPPMITTLTGITSKMVQNAPSISEIAPKIMEMTKNKIFVAHNINFDYFFFRNELKRLGFFFREKKLCTVKLSRLAIPGLPSYSLGKLCKSLDIPLNNRHRALGDAMATGELLKKILSLDSDKLIQNFLKDELSDSMIPPHISRTTIDHLPEDIGLYFFYNKEGKILYVGKSKNIRNDVIQHFQKGKKTLSTAMKKEIFKISYELTGSEMIASIKKSIEVKKSRFPFHHDFNNNRKIYGVFHKINNQGYQIIVTKKMNANHDNHNENLILECSSSKNSRHILRGIVQKYKLCPKLCGLENRSTSCSYIKKKRCLGACIGKETPENYNQRFEDAFFASLHYPSSNLFIIEEGRKGLEKSIIHIENGKFKGFGYFEPNSFKDCLEKNISEIKKNIHPITENSHIRKILCHYLSKSKSTYEKIIY